MKIFRTPLLILALGACLHLPAWADLEMTQEMSIGEKSATMVTRFKLNKEGELGWVRVDNPNGVALITDFERRQVIALNEQQKVATISNFRALRRKLPSDEGVKAAAPVGRDEQEGGQESAVYSGVLQTPAGEAKLTLWVAKAHPQQQKVVPLVKAYTESPVLRSTAGLSKSLEGLEGVVMRSDVEVAGQVVTTRLVSLEEKEIPQDVFEIPEGFTKEKR